MRDLPGELHPVVIIGAGIAGLSAAIALSRRGYRVLVIEKRTDVQEAGAGLQLSPNASHILIRWGLGPALAQTAVAPTEVAIRRWAEPRAYARVPFNGDSVDDNAPFWVMLRQDLHRALRDAAAREPLIRLQFGMSLDSMTDAGHHRTLRFSMSGQTIDIDALCVIGADGQRSRVRQLLGDARDLDAPGWEAWRTVIPAEKTPDFIKAAVTNLWLGRDSHAVHYPVAGGRQVNLVVIRRSIEMADGWSRPGDAGEIAGLAATAAPTLRDLIAQAPDWAVWTLHDRAPSPFLSRGTGALIGDAAHPVLPFLAQGAAMAIEDAAVLAASLPTPDRLDRAGIEIGLLDYAAARGHRVNQAFKAARNNAFAYHLPRPLAWVRDRRMAQLGPDGMRRRYAWLYDWRTKTL